MEVYMAVQINIQAKVRDQYGKGANRKLRQKGLTPAILYGNRENALPLYFDTNEFNKKTHGELHENTIFNLKIEGDPMAVALDLSIDAEFFYWACQHKPERVLYPSSSAAYPISLQSTTGAIALSESDIDFTKNLGVPDMTYGWSKLTGEFLAQIAARHYGIPVVCIRPFSGYGEDQNLSYPVPAIAARAARKENPFEVWGSGKQGRDFVHIDDVLDLIFILMANVSDGSAYNIGSGKLTSFLDLISIFAEFAGYSPEIKALLDKPVGVHSRYSDMSLVQGKFGWMPKISVEEGMKRVYDAALMQI